MIPQLNLRAVAVMALLPASAITALTLILTTDRTPHPVSYQTSVRTDGCVMFCQDMPPSSFNDANCGQEPPVIGLAFWECEPNRAPQPKPKSDGCVMFCDEPRLGGDR